MRGWTQQVAHVGVRSVKTRKGVMQKGSSGCCVGCADGLVCGGLFQAILIILADSMMDGCRSVCALVK